MKIKSIHYYNRYLKLIDIAKTKDFSNEFCERHHIIPKSMGGTDSQDNLIKLNARYHFIAHWLLYKAFGTYKMISAFQLMLTEGHTKNNRYKKINSKVFQKLREQIAINCSNRMRGTVVVTDSNNKSYRVTIEEAKSNNDLIICNTDKVSGVFDVYGNKVSVTKEEYKQGDYVRYNKGQVPVKDINGNKFLTNNKDPKFLSGEYIHVSKGLITALDLRTNQTISITKEQFDANSYYVGPNFNKTGQENYNAKIIHIFNNKDELQYICHGNFEKVCKENGLPFSTLKASYMSNKKSPIYKSKRSETEAKKRGFEQYIGWYALKM